MMLDRLLELAARLKNTLTNGLRDRDADDELALHVQMATADNLRRGMSAEEARRQAIISLGGIDRTREMLRDARGLPRFERALQDLSFTCRALRREPGFAATAVLILAIAIGANAAIFAVVRALVLQPLPFTAPERLVWIVNGKPERSLELSAITHLPDVWDGWRRRSRLFEDLAAFNAFFAYDSYRLTAAGEPVRIGGVQVSQNFLGVLGVTPQLGRFFTDHEMLEGGPRAVVLTHAFWRLHFGSDPSIVGRTISIDGEGATVAGVLPSSFDFSSVFSPATRVDFLSPLYFQTVRDWGNTLSVVGRLQPGATLQAAQQEIDAITTRLKTERTDLWGNFTGRLIPLSDEISGRATRAVLLVWCAVGAVLLIACANLSSLLLTRAGGRRREFAIRAAIGASAGRLVWLLLTESLVLSTLGAAAGIVLASLALQRVSALDGLAIPLVQRTALDGFVLAFTGVITIATAVLVGIWPGLAAGRVDLNEVLKDGGRGTPGRGQRRLTSALVVGEVGLACALLVIAGLLTRSLYQVLSVDLGFQPDAAIAVKIDPVATTPTAQRMAFLSEAVQRVRALPGVVAAGVTDTLPLDRNRGWGVKKPGTQSSNVFSGYEPALVSRVGPGFLHALGISLLAGRDISEHDREGAAPVVIINAKLARAFWPDHDAIDREMTINNFNARVIGVVADVHHGSLEEASGFEIYLPMTQQGASTVDLVVRTRTRSEAVIGDLRATLSALDPTLPLNDIRPVRHLVDRAVSPRRFFALLLAGFAGMALLLASLGIYGVISGSVARQNSEIALRLALGELPGQVRGRLIGQAIGLAAIGIVGGTTLAFAASRVMSALVFGISSVDPATFVGVPLVLGGVAALSGAIPAYRASRIDPITAIRQT